MPPQFDHPPLCTPGFKKKICGRNFPDSFSILFNIFVHTEAWKHIGMLSASYREDPGSNPGKGENY